MKSRKLETVTHLPQCDKSAKPLSDPALMLKLRNLPVDLSLFSPVSLLATWGHSGRIAPASGTWGSLAALPFALFILHIWGVVGLSLFAIVTFALGFWAIPRYAKACGQKDPSEVVLDEVVGVALTYLPLASLDPMAILVGFTAFRLLDALKPGPIGWCDRQLKGAWGVMMDDVVAGILAALCVYGYQTLN